MEDTKRIRDESNLIPSPVERVRERSELKIKICGMKIPENIYEVAALKPDFIGFIFYPKSPRFAEPLDVDVLNTLSPTIKKIGVFVNENLENILTICTKYQLDGVQ